MDLVIKNNSTGESKSFAPTKEGYAQADAYAQSIAQTGAGVSDGGSGAISRISNYFSNTGNAGRSGTPKSWF